MKRTFCHIVLFLSLIVCQAGSQTNWEEYYPLHDGNLWQYDDSTYPFNITYTRQVVRDTIASNGKTYKVIQVRTWDGPYPGTSHELQRIDSLGNVYVYADTSCTFPATFGDKLIYRLQGEIGDSIPTCEGQSAWFLTQKDTIGLFDEPRELITYDLVGSVVRGILTTASGIGLIHQGFEGGDRTLKGAVIDGTTYGIITVSVSRPMQAQPSNWRVVAYPNPFNSTTNIEYVLEQSSRVEVAVVDLLGRTVKFLLRAIQPAGSYTIRWDGKDEKGRIVHSGMYFAVVRAKGTSIVSKLILAK